MKFKDLKVGDTIYVKNPISRYKPIKKIIGRIIPFNELVPFESNSEWLDGYAEDRDFPGIPYNKLVPFESNSERLDFYDENGDFLGAAMPNCSRGLGIGNMIFADFAAFKQDLIDCHKHIIRHLDYEIDRLIEQIRLAHDDLEIINEMQDEE